MSNTSTTPTSFRPITDSERHRFAQLLQATAHALLEGQLNFVSSTFQIDVEVRSHVDEVADDATGVVQMYAGPMFPVAASISAAFRR